MLQISQHQITLPAENELARLKEDFSRQHCVVLVQLLGPALLDLILKKVESAEFYSQSHKDHRRQEFGSDLTLRENEAALHLIHFALNHPMVLGSMQEITGCTSIASFAGRIYRNLPRANHQLNWHNDTDQPERVLGFSINLSQRPYQGGAFQLREESSGRICCEVNSRNPGDAHLFLISPALAHRVTALAGDAGRTSAAGWFLSAPDRATVLRKLANGVGARDSR